MFSALNTQYLGKTLLELEECPSTSTLLRENAKKSPTGTVVITHHQTQGKGQKGNHWQSEKGKNLTFSVLLRPTFISTNDIFSLNIAVSLAVYKTIKTYIDFGLQLKWSNDIYVKNQKLGGILIENTIENASISQSIIGIGLNINGVTFDNLPQATSLKIATQSKCDFSLNQIFESLLESIENEFFRLEALENSPQKEDYLSHLLGYQEWRRYKKKDIIFDGKIQSIDTWGRLGIETTDQNINFFDFKEIEFLF